jgi:hypothetical protein
MMMLKSETMALMMALMPAAMALTIVMMQLPMVRKTDLICCLLVFARGLLGGGRVTYAGYNGAHCCGWCVGVVE